MKQLSIIFVMLMIFSACKKDPESSYSGQNGITFYYMSGAEQDSVSYSFVLNKIPKSKDTVWVKMRLVGKLSDKPREIKVIAGPGSTAIAGTHYILPDYVLPAGSFTVKYPVVLLSTPDLDNKSVRLVMRVADSKDLVAGTTGQADPSSANTIQFKVNFSNKLIKPDYWGYIAGYIGEYSDVRYQFMIDVFGTPNFRPDSKGGSIGYPQWLNIQARLNNALDKYISQHGPLIDENEEEVVFPAF
ncbi:DUF4843 domain-containing protein [Pedobacter nyackensis]|uniref:DUF4843 domain-containing protein n=1 Tax=Pedobacter nyackensis TaxID=475255 RepID=UPI0029316A09|nr:DUF4843 domain-containing protein [Pedobacter nyackensis]